MEELITRIESEQNDYALGHEGKFLCVAKTKDGNNDYSVTEYVTPNKEKGFQIVFYREVAGNEECKSIGYGPEANERTFDWCLKKEL